VDFDADDPHQLTGGTRRFWDFAVREWIQFELPRDVGWALLDASPFNPPQSPK
jgi:hypothetical protein